MNQKISLTFRNPHTPIVIVAAMGIVLSLGVFRLVFDQAHQSNDWMAPVILLAGLLFTVVVAAYLKLTLRHAFRAEALAQQLSAEVEERKQSEQALGKTTESLQCTISELERANQHILRQQKSVIEQEHLQLLLNMAGTTAHGLNQPLMALLGNIELMEMDMYDPQKLTRHMNQVNKAGQRIADLVKKIQAIRHEEGQSSVRKAVKFEYHQELAILCIEDTDTDFSAINAVLEPQEKITLAWAKNLKEAQHRLARQPFDLIFLDYVLPDGNGLEFLKRLNASQLNTPVVVITGQGDELIASQIIQAGAYDYLPKSKISETSLARVITNTIDKYRLRKEVDSVMKKMAELSIKDELTSLYNRRYLSEALEREIAIAQRYHRPLALCMMDLDHFKQINDTYGHAAGDAVLQEFSRILQDNIRRGDIACRYGGEEFTIILPDSRSEETHLFCERFRKKVADNVFTFNDEEIHVTISVGITTLDNDQACSPKHMLQAADEAMYTAKRNGRNLVRETSMAA